MRYTRNIQKWENDTYPYQWPYPPNMALLKAQYLNFRILKWPLLSLKSIVMGGTFFSNRPNWFCSARQGGPSCCMALIPVKSTRGAPHPNNHELWMISFCRHKSHKSWGDHYLLNVQSSKISNSNCGSERHIFCRRIGSIGEILMKSWWLSDALQDENSPVLIPTAGFHFNRAIL